LNFISPGKERFLSFKRNKNKKQKFFNVGSLKLRVRKGKTTGIYSVQSIKDLTEVIIPHFQKYP